MQLGTGQTRGTAYSAPEEASEFCTLETLEDIATILTASWKLRGLDEAVKMIVPLLELVEELINLQSGEEIGTITPYIYTLF